MELILDIKTILVTAVFTLVPIFELRGSIPYGLIKELPLGLVFPMCVALNALVAPLVFLFLSTFNKLFLKMSWYEKLFNRFVERARDKVKDKVDRFGYLGIMLFVAIPLPITGAYTGTLGAWILGLSKRKTMLAVALGVVISGTIVSTIVLTGAQGFDFLIKHI